jgi:predicted XRE-type DNA-binding protein
MKRAIGRSKGARYEEIRTQLKGAIAETFAEMAISQSAAAERFGVGRTYLNDVLNGDTRNVSVGTLLAMLLRVDVDLSLTISNGDERWRSSHGGSLSNVQTDRVCSGADRRHDLRAG